MTRRHLISVDELRAAGALDVPAAWRKSLGAAERELPLFPDDDEASLFPDDEELREVQSQAPLDAEEEGSGDRAPA